MSDLQIKIVNLRREGEERAAERLARQLGHQYVDLRQTPAFVDAIKLLPEAVAKDAKIATIELKGRKVALAAVNPDLAATKKAVKELESQKYEVKIFVASPSSLKEAWSLYRFIKPEAGELTGIIKLNPERIRGFNEKLTNFTAIQEEIKKIDFLKASPVHVAEVILGGAMAIKASDIHLESGEKKAKIRLRVDGLLHDVFTEMPLRSYNFLISRIKLLSDMKLNVRDEAQDGRFTINLENKEIEIRVSVIPSEFGETVVMRILDPEVTAIGLASLGLREDDLEIAEAQLAKPNGLILNTGPTGSGKTTTLYAFLRHINNPEMKIITLEDPIEYRLEGIEQTQVDNESGYTFSSGLRAIVRQDPDVILVGEIRDKDTSDIALQAALTGHLVLSTLHTNDAVGAVPRLVNLGVQPVSIGPAINLVIAQRLVRKLCEHCKKEKEPELDIRDKIEKFLESLPSRVDKEKYKDYKIFAPGGCEQCNNFGYKGRIGIFEFLQGGMELEEVVLKDLSEISLKRLSEKQNMVTMQEDGVLKALSGDTTLDEVESVTGKIEWSGKIEK